MGSTKPNPGTKAGAGSRLRTSGRTLASRIKRARDIMRKDAGVNGDLDRIPQLAWLLFLKAFDDLERVREAAGPTTESAIPPPYRWRDWASNASTRRRGDDLTRFVNGELLPRLRALQGAGPTDRRTTISEVFRETNNTMLSGDLLSDVIELVNTVDFASDTDVHTMAHLYESMLMELRDAAGDSGEFYTPRPVIQFIVERLAPRVGEKVLDPAVGTGGFLVEALAYLVPQTRTDAERASLDACVQGIEKKSLPYLLGVMNLVLHGVEVPSITRGNALATPIRGIESSGQVDVVATNPPFGGEEERSVQKNFPAETRTAETALLFLQLIQARLASGGRCGMVVPNNVLYQTGVAAEVKRRLFATCDVHTIVRLPPGVFAPSTDIPTNVLFFDKGARTQTTWFYELRLPEGKRQYTKSSPIRPAAFDACRAWWGGPGRSGRKENSHAWCVRATEAAERDFDLDFRNPHPGDQLVLRTTDDILGDLRTTERALTAAIASLTELLSQR